MRSLKIGFFYVSIISGFSVLIYWIAFRGAALESKADVAKPDKDVSAWWEFVESIFHNLNHPLSILLAQITVVIVTARFFGWVFKQIGQPTVMGEIIAGIVLGPSLVGIYFPEFSQALFPPQSMASLQFLSQIGLIMFMFIVGMELDLKVLRNRAHEAVVISHASIVVPFALGMVLSYYIYESFAPSDVSFLSFGLFMGIAMSITAFPVLARIVQERGMHKTRLGMVVITCAAADDITAWCILAAVIAMVKAGSFVSALYVMVLSAAYVLLMIRMVRPFLARVGDLHASLENLSKPVVGIFFLTVILSSFATEVIGIHALFGAFMAGVIMPENAKFRSIFIGKIEDVALVLLLPLFFVFTGLRTQIGLLDDPYLWSVALIIILVAVAGKFMGSALAARFVGQSWKDSLTIGALMNTRGLMELVVLNIGYDLGVLSPEVFAMMVIMALVTTFMTGPVLDLINKTFKAGPQELPEPQTASQYNVLISFANPESGRTLLRIAHSLINRFNARATVAAMHLSPINALHHYNIEEYETESFAPIVAESQRLNQPVITLFKPSNDIEGDIAAVANKGDYDLLLMGLGHSIFEGTLLGKILGFTTSIVNPGRLLNKVTRRTKTFYDSPFDERTSGILSRCYLPVGIFIGNHLEKITNVFMPVLDADDGGLVSYAKKFIISSGARVTVVFPDQETPRMTRVREMIMDMSAEMPGSVSIENKKNTGRSFLKDQDLMLVSLASWKALVETRAHWLPDAPSTLVIAHSSSQ